MQLFGATTLQLAPRSGPCQSPVIFRNPSLSGPVVPRGLWSCSAAHEPRHLKSCSRPHAARYRNCASLGEATCSVTGTSILMDSASLLRINSHKSRSTRTFTGPFCSRYIFFTLSMNERFLIPVSPPRFTVREARG